MSIEDFEPLSGFEIALLVAAYVASAGVACAALVGLYGWLFP